MAKTEVILVDTVQGLGGESDQVKVAAGYARNFLYPRGLAIPLTAANKRRLDALRKRRSEREAHEIGSMTELAQTLSKLTLVIQVKTGDDGRLFGSVTAVDIAEQLKHQYDVTLDRRKIHLDHPIKMIGEHEAELRLHSQVVTPLKIRVESTSPLAKKTEPAPAPEASSEAAKAPPKKTKAGPKSRPKTEQE